MRWGALVRPPFIIDRPMDHCLAKKWLTSRGIAAARVRTSRLAMSALQRSGQPLLLPQIKLGVQRAPDNYAS